MIVQSIRNLWDTFQNQYRNTVYKTLVDPESEKTYTEITVYIYDRHGQIEEVPRKNNVDKQA